MKKTIIVGSIEFLEGKVLIHSLDEVYQADTEEELDALKGTFDNEGSDWLVIETCRSTIEITPIGLLGVVWGSKKSLTYLHK
jgi:hypothetical protein